MITKNLKIALAILVVISVQFIYLSYNIIFKSVYEEVVDTDNLLSMAKNYMDNYPTEFFIQVALLVVTLIPYTYFWMKYMNERKAEAARLKAQN